jgi:hypothetical protein
MAMSWGSIMLPKQASKAQRPKMPERLQHFMFSCETISTAEFYLTTKHHQQSFWSKLNRTSGYAIHQKKLCEKHQKQVLKTLHEFF